VILGHLTAPFDFKFRHVPAAGGFGQPFFPTTGIAALSDRGRAYQLGIAAKTASLAAGPMTRKARELQYFRTITFSQFAWHIMVLASLSALWCPPRGIDLAEPASRGDDERALQGGTGSCWGRDPFHQP